MWRCRLKWLSGLDAPVVISLWVFSASACPGDFTQSHLRRRVVGARVVIKSSVSLREDQHAFAKASHA